MRKKIAALLIWILLTVIYVVIERDMGRAMGFQTSHAIEKCAETYAGSEDKEAVQIDPHETWYNLHERYKGDFTESSIITVIYMVCTIGCYHFGFVSADEDEKESANKKE